MPSASISHALGDDTTLLGAAVDTFEPAVIEEYGAVGLDFAWVDLEHSGPSPYDSTRLEPLVRAADAADITLLVRVPAPEPPLIRKVLDAGVRTILLPRVTTPAEVEQGIRASKFTYDGEPGDRGVGSGRASQWGRALDPSYTQAEDEAISVGAMFEHRDAMANLSDILAVPALDFTFLGHWDLTVSMGESTPSAERVQAEIESFVETCHSHDVPFGRNIPLDADAVTAATSTGYNLLLVGSELAAVRDVYGALLD